MIKLTTADRSRTVSISMRTWDGNQYTPDWSDDFFNVGSLPLTDDEDAFIVGDIDYCIEQAMDWENGEGDFRDDLIDCPDEIDNRSVWVTEL